MQTMETHTENALVYTTRYHDSVLTRDGIKLSTIVHRVSEDNLIPRPTLLIRTPYSAKGFFSLAKMMGQNFPIKLNYVLQDCRGRYDSQGEFDMLNERNDTLDTMNWIAQQEWSNRDIHIFGPSYLGWVALQVLQEESNANLVSIFSPMTFSDLLDNAIYTDGVLNLHHSYPFSMMMCSRVQGPLTYMNTPFPKAYDIAIEKGVTHQGYDAKIWNMVLDKQRLRDLTINHRNDPNFNTKATFVASYYDNICRGSIRAFEKVNDIGGAKPDLILGPWGHNGYVNSLDSVGKFKITNAQANVAKHLKEHFDTLNSTEQKIQVYILRLDKWVQTNQWPLTTSPSEINFQLNGVSNHISAKFDNPVRTWGGPVWDNALVEGLDPGPYDQRGINRRDDVIRLYTNVYDKDTVYAGRINVKVKAAASLANSHITAKLNIVEEDGTEYILQDGIKIIENQNEMSSHVIDLNYSAFQIRKGEKLMIEISWTNFPKYARPLHRSDYKLTLDPTEPITLELQKYSNQL